MSLLREPLVHFFALGALLYLIHAALGDGDWQKPDVERTVRVTAGEVHWLEEGWRKRWNRAPTSAERQGLIDEYVRETILYREALAMGLDEDDTIVRRRLAQKLEFLSRDLLEPVEPSQAALRAYFDAHLESYRAPARVTFTHVYFDPDRRGEQTLADAEALRRDLQTGGAPAAEAVGLGDPFMLGSDSREMPEPEVRALFGGEFASALSELDAARWHGPILSGYGAHLVFVHGRSESHPPAFADVAEAVRRDWDEDRRRELDERFYQGLRARWTIIVEAQGDAETLALQRIEQ